MIGISCRRSKWTLLFLGTAVVAALLLLSTQFSSSFLPEEEEDIFAYATYGSAPGLTYESTQIQSAENCTLFIELTENATKAFVQLGNPVLLACNSPFLKKSQKVRYVNISHDHVASIVMLSTGYHTPALQEESLPLLKPFVGQVSCDYAAAARDIFDDSLYTIFVEELKMLIISSSTWRRKLGFDSQWKSGESKVSFKAHCFDGQLTTLGLAQHLAAGRKIADAFNESPSIQSIKQNILERGDRIKLPVTLRRSEANAMGVLATLFGMAYDLRIGVSLSQLADSLQLTWSKYDNLCDMNKAEKNVSLPSCKCDSVDVAEREHRTAFDNAITSILVADNINKDFISSYREVLDHFGISRSEPHRFFDAVHELQIPVCALPDTLLCTSNSSDDQHRCLSLDYIKETFSTAKSLYDIVASQVSFSRISVLRSFPFVHLLFDKVTRLTASETAVPVPVEFLFVNSQTLTDMLRIFGISFNYVEQIMQHMPFGSVVTLEVFRTTRRNPGTLVVRLLVNGLSSLRQSRLCGRAYSGMCDLQEILLAYDTLLVSHLGQSDYNSACIPKFAI